MTPPNVQLPRDWGFKTCLMGPMGSGKTSSLRTLLNPAIKLLLGHDLEIFALFTEPSPMNVLSDILPKIHWNYVAPAVASWATLLDTAGKIESMSNKQLQGLSKGMPGTYNQFLQIIRLCNDFVDADGKHWGDIKEFSNNRVFWLDSLTGLNKMAKRLVAGQSPILTQPDWGVSMEFLQNFIDTLTCSLKCHFVLCAHVEYGEDEVTTMRQTRLLISTLGRKLAPVLPTTFSDVVLSIKLQGGIFKWSTDYAMAELRNTYLPIKAELDASFVPVIQSWKMKLNVNESK